MDIKRDHPWRLYMTPEETAAIWRKLIPPGTVEDLPIDGRRLEEIDIGVLPDSGGHQADTFNTTAAFLPEEIRI
jgi:hypothetical protein